MHSYRVFITLLTNPIVASSAAFLGVSQPIIGTASTSLNSRSPGSNDSPVNTFDLDTADPIHESGNENRYGEYGYNVSDDDDDDNYDDEGEDGDDDEDEDDDEDDDDAWEEEFDPNSDNIADRETSLNTTFHTSGSNKRTLHVKKIKCSHHWAGQNILGAVDALTDWGHEHLVGRKNVSRLENGRSLAAVIRRGTRDLEKWETYPVTSPRRTPIYTTRTLETNDYSLTPPIVAVALGERPQLPQIRHRMDVQLQQVPRQADQLLGDQRGPPAHREEVRARKDRESDRSRKKRVRSYVQKTRRLAPISPFRSACLPFLSSPLNCYLFFLCDLLRFDIVLMSATTSRFHRTSAKGSHDQPVCKSVPPYRLLQPLQHHDNPMWAASPVQQGSPGRFL